MKRILVFLAILLMPVLLLAQSDGPFGHSSSSAPDSADWATQYDISSMVDKTGTPTANAIPKFSDANTLTVTGVTDDGTTVTITLRNAVITTPGGSAIGLSLDNNKSSGVLFQFINDNDGAVGDSSVWALANGNLGLGVAAGSYRLNVNGAANVSSNFTAGGSINGVTMSASLFRMSAVPYYFDNNNAAGYFTFRLGAGYREVMKLDTMGVAFTPNTTTAAGTSVSDDGCIKVTNSVMRVVGADADAVLDTSPAINDGTLDGQIVYIFGTSDANTVTIADNCNTQLVGGVSCTLGILDNIVLMWDAGNSNWVEISRANN